MDTVKHTKHTGNESQKKQREKEPEKRFEEIMAENFPHLVKNIESQIKEAGIKTKANKQNNHFR